jgi:hypothetical protein
MYDVTETEYGYTLSNGYEVYLLNESKKRDTKASPYYLKQVEPIKKYICGLFKESKKNSFKGKHYSLYRVYIDITGNTAYINFKGL